jgi:hypothetical protein
MLPLVSHCNQQGYLQTGQTICHDGAGIQVACAGSGQDAEFQRGLRWPTPRFQPRDEVVIDRLTGLTWTRTANLAVYPLTWREALAFVAEMNRNNVFAYSDWRLPNRRELRSLVSHQNRRPVLPHGHPFRDVFPGWYWTSTSAAINPAYAWYVNLDGGRMFYGGKFQSYLVWPVRGKGHGILPCSGQKRCYDEKGKVIPCTGSGQDGEFRRGKDWPEPRFQVFGSQVLDRLTGLYWHNPADLVGNELTWSEALAWVNEIDGTWRLPNINELESLVDCSRHSPALPRNHPFKKVRDVYWSSTTSMFEPDWAWALYLTKGTVGVGHKRSAPFHVWAVR